MKTDNLLSIVIPTYKEAENIRILIPKIEETLESIGIQGEIIIVDDDSQDGIVEFIETLKPRYNNISLIVRNGVCGIASAWLEGMNASRGSKIVIMDADLCHDPCYFQPMLEKLKEYDMVIGSRYMPGHETQMLGKSFIAVFVSKLGQIMYRWILQQNLRDSSHSFRMCHREVYLSLKDDLRFDGNVMMMEFAFKTIRAGFRVVEIPVTYGERIYGETKLEIPTQGLKFLKALFYLRLLNKKEL